MVKYIHIGSHYVTLILSNIVVQTDSKMNLRFGRKNSLKFEIPKKHPPTSKPCFVGLRACMQACLFPQLCGWEGRDDAWSTGSGGISQWRVQREDERRCNFGAQAHANDERDDGSIIFPHLMMHMLDEFVCVVQKRRQLFMGCTCPNSSTWRL